MKKIFSSLVLIGLLLCNSTSLLAQSVVPAKWLVAANKPWFNGASNNVRGMAFNPVTNRVYVASRDAGINAVIILNASTGDSVGVLIMTGITGGTFTFNRLGVSSDGRIYTTNLTTAVTKAAPLKIYTWADESSAPVVAFADSVQGPRLGDALAVTGSGQETYVYVSGNATPGPVNVFKRSGDTLLHYKTIVPTGWAGGVLGIGPMTNGFGSFWVNVSGKTAQSYDTLGNVLDTIPGTIVASGASSAHYFELGGRKFVGMYSGNPTASLPSVARFAEVTVGAYDPYVAGITASLGTTANSNATGEVIYSAADTSVYVLSTNNGVGKFDVKAAVPVITYNTRAPFVPMAGQNDTVYLNVLSMKNLTSVNLGYYGMKSAASDQNGDDSGSVAMTVQANSQGRVHYAVIPGSANRDGRRIDYLGKATDALNVMGESVRLKGYFAGTTKMMLKDGPRNVDSNGVMTYTTYGMRIKGVNTAEDSVYQTTNNEVVFQDNWGGVTVFKSGTTLDLMQGNEYSVVGTISQFNGKFQLVNPPLEIIDLGPGPKIAPKVVTIKELVMNGEEYENSLVEIRGVSPTPSSLAWPGANADANMTFVDGSGDSATMRVDRDTELSGTPSPRFPATIIGVAGQFDNSNPFTAGYQWLPRGRYDIIQHVQVRVKDSTAGVLNADISVPVLVGNITDEGITSYQFTTHFDTTSLQFMGASTMNSISAGYTFSANLAPNGRIQVAGSGTMPLKDSGALYHYHFKVLKTGSSMVSLTGEFNEGNPAAFTMGGIVHGYLIPITRQAMVVENAKIRTAVTNVGHIGALNAYQDNAGFVYNGADRLYEGSLIMGNAKNRVPNAARFQAAPSWNPGFRHLSLIKMEKLGSTIQTETSFDDSSYGSPLGIKVDQHTALDTAAGKDGFMLFGYDIINRTANPINGFQFGAFLDFDMTSAGDADRGAIIKDSTNQIPGVISGNKFKFMVAYINNGTNFAGIVPLTHSDFTGARIAVGPNEVYSGRMVDSNKFNYITTFRPTNTYGDGGTANDMSIFAGVGPYAIPANDTVTAAFALVVGQSIQELVNNARLAQQTAVQQYGIQIAILTDVKEHRSGVPTAFALDQNYPNPFNPSTSIRFALPNAGNVRLAVYDILGREVRSLVNNALDAGYHQITWDGRSNLGSQVASGVYIYRIEAGSFISTKKMMLMK